MYGRTQQFNNTHKKTHFPLDKNEKVQKDEPIKVPSINPMRAYREEQSKKEAECEQNKLNIIIENIEAYDGTAAGQKDVN